MTSYKSFLMIKETGDWKKLVDIVDFPPLGGAPELLDKTTLSHSMEIKEPGIQKADGKEFTINYDLNDYKKLKALEGQEKEYAVWLGGTEQSDGSVTPTGIGGKFLMPGKLSVWVEGAGVNQVLRMKTMIAISKPIVQED